MKNLSGEKFSPRFKVENFLDNLRLIDFASNTQSLQRIGQHLQEWLLYQLLKHSIFLTFLLLLNLWNY